MGFEPMFHPYQRCVLDQLDESGMLPGTVIHGYPAYRGVWSRRGHSNPTLTGTNRARRHLRFVGMAGNI